MTQKSESVSEAEPLSKEAQQAREWANLPENIRQSALAAISRWEIYEFLANYAKSVTLKLAEEADREEADHPQGSHWNRHWRAVAAWLREKAR